MGLNKFEKSICPKTGRPYPEMFTGVSKKAREFYDKRVPANEDGKDVPPIEKRDLWWTQVDLCDGIVGASDWLDLAEDESWWDWVVNAISKSEGDFQSIRGRMEAAIKKQKSKIQNKLRQ